MDTKNKSVENRLLAALAHGAIFAQGIGILVGVLVYINQRDQSRYTTFQALQAAIGNKYAGFPSSQFRISC